MICTHLHVYSNSFFLWQYFADCNEISATMDELDLAASNDDLGQDEESVGELAKKHMVNSSYPTIYSF